MQEANLLWNKKIGVLSKIKYFGLYTLITIQHLNELFRFSLLLFNNEEKERKFYISKMIGKSQRNSALFHPIVKAFPRLFTIRNLLCGVFLITFNITVFGNDLHFYFLITVLDLLDGRIGRRLKVNSEIGVELEIR